jgi:threonine aldolase
MEYRDFRSDTVTQPTPAMRVAMMEAVVGDDILREDPTVQELEATAATMFGKEAALFTISGTMANQVAIMALTQLGDEIIVGAESHIYNLEVGGLAGTSGVQARPLRTERGRFDLAEFHQAIRLRGIQSPITRVVCLENTYSLNDGFALPRSYLQAVADIAHDQGIQVYLDGARVFNASVALGTDVQTLCQDVDVLMFCLSKGLAAPIGSVLMGTQAFIDRARWVRQRLGGGMRQAGHMAAAGLVALRTMVTRLAEDHELAQRLARGLAAINPGLVKLDETETNIVHLHLDAVGRTATEVVEQLLEQGIKIKWIGPTECRMITHYGITAADVDEAVAAIREIVG